MNAFKKTLLSLTLALSTLSLANVTAPPVDTTRPLPTLGSMNQLGELSFSVPTMIRFHTRDGVPVIFTPIKGLPMVDVSLSFQAGSAYDTQIRADGFGLANMTATLITKGTARLSEDEFLEKSESLGVQLSASASRDAWSLNLRSLSQKDTLDPAVALMMEALTTPAFDETVLKRTQTQLITALTQQEQVPSHVANVAFFQTLFNDHPYAHPVTGTKDSVSRLSQAELFAFSKRFLVAQNAVITLTGDLSETDAKLLAEKLATALPTGEKAPALPTPATPKATHVHINHPSPQTAILMGNLSTPLLSTKSALHAQNTFDLANKVLAGGDFGTRLMDEIRVKKGYTYGIYGNNQQMSTAGIYAISFATQSEKTADALFDTLAVIKDAQTSGIRQDELDLVRFESKNNFPNEFSSNSGIHRLARYMNFYALPDSYLKDYAKSLDQISLKDANAALNHTIMPENFIIITVGNQAPNLVNIGR
ncbi:MAG: pitrilysin family protein [Moraxella sp.]|nr:pitrilysin family protein [Moraxella sp.]